MRLFAVVFLDCAAIFDPAAGGRRLAAGGRTADDSLGKGRLARQCAPGISAAADGAGEVDESEWLVGLRGQASEWRRSRTNGTAQILVPFPIESALSGVMKRVGTSSDWLSPHVQVAGAEGRPAAALAFRGGGLGLRSVWSMARTSASTRGGYDPFTFDVTDALDKSEVRAGADRRGQRSERCELAAAGQAGAKPKRHLVHADDGHLADGVAGGSAGRLHRVVSRSCRMSMRRVVRVTVNVRRGGRGPTAAVRCSMAMRQDRRRRGKLVKPIEVEIPKSAKPWSPDSPISLRSAGRSICNGSTTVDTVNSYFAHAKNLARQGRARRHADDAE